MERRSDKGVRGSQSLLGVLGIDGNYSGKNLAKLKNLEKRTLYVTLQVKFMI